MFSVWVLFFFLLYIYRYIKIYRRRWSNWNVLIWCWALFVFTGVVICINLDDFIYFYESHYYIIFFQVVTLGLLLLYPWIHYHTIGDMTVPFWRHNYRNIWDFSTLRVIFKANLYQKDLFLSWTIYQKKNYWVMLNYFPYWCIFVLILYYGIFKSNNELMFLPFYFINWHLNRGLAIVFIITIIRSLFTNNFVFNNFYILRTTLKYPGKMDALFHFWSLLPWHDWRFIYKIDNEFPVFAPEAKLCFKTTESWMFFERLDWMKTEWRYNIPSSWTTYKFIVLDQLAKSKINLFLAFIPKVLIIIVHYIHYFFNEIDEAGIDEIEQFFPEYVYYTYFI